MYHGPDEFNTAERSRINAVEKHSGDRPDEQRTDERRQAPPQRW